MIQITDKKYEMSMSHAVKDYQDDILIDGLQFEDGVHLNFHTDYDILLKDTNIGEHALWISNTGTGMIHIIGNSKSKLDRFAKLKIEANSVVLEKIDLLFAKYKKDTFQIDTSKLTILDSRFQNILKKDAALIKIRSTNGLSVLEEKEIEEDSLMKVMTQSLAINQSSINCPIHCGIFQEEKTILACNESRAQLSFLDYMDPIDEFYAYSSDIVFLNGVKHPIRKSEIKNSSVIIQKKPMLFETISMEEGSNLCVSHSASQGEMMCQVNALTLDEDSLLYSIAKDNNFMVGNYCYSELDQKRNQEREVLEVLKQVKKQKTLRK